MKIRAVVAELFHAKRRMDGRTDTMNLIVAFRNFANAPKNLRHGFLCRENIYYQITRSPTYESCHHLQPSGYCTYRARFTIKTLHSIHTAYCNSFTFKTLHFIHTVYLHYMSGKKQRSRYID